MNHEPFRPNLPDERLRRVCRKWDCSTEINNLPVTTIVTFDGSVYRSPLGDRWQPIHNPRWGECSFRPLDRTWADVEREAAELPQESLREVTRVITYRGSERAIAEQLGRSLPDGVKISHVVEISVKTLEDSTGLLLGTADPAAALLKRLGEVGREMGELRLALRDMTQGDPNRLLQIEELERQRDAMRALAQKRGEEIQRLTDLLADKQCTTSSRSKY